MITEITRWGVRARVGERGVTIDGEILLPTGDGPNFVIYKGSIRWSDGPEGEAIDAATKEKILADVVLEMEQKAWRVVVE